MPRKCTENIGVSPFDHQKNTALMGFHGISELTKQVLFLSENKGYLTYGKKPTAKEMGNM